MYRMETEASYGEIWNWLDSDGRPVIFKFSVCKDINVFLYGRVTTMLGLAGCMSWTGVLYMT